MIGSLNFERAILMDMKLWGMKINGRFLYHEHNVRRVRHVLVSRVRLACRIDYRTISQMIYRHGSFLPLIYSTGNNLFGNYVNLSYIPENALF